MKLASIKLASVLCWLVVGGTALAGEPSPDQKFQRTERHMGTSCTVVLYAPDETAANRGFDAAFGRIHTLDTIMSDYDEASELSRLSDATPTAAPVKISDDLWPVLQRSQEISQLTDGAFDITVGPLTKLWRRARRQKEMPSPERLAEARAAVGHQHLRLHADQHTAELMKPKMRLDLGGIGQGVAADQALAILKKLGLPRALVNASGDIAAGDAPPGEPGWKIGIAPLDSQSPPSRIVRLTNAAISTSGDAFQFVELNGTRYSHIVDPKTGLGLTQRISVSIIAPDCTTADALATTVCVLGPTKGIELIDKLPNTAALIVVATDDGVKTLESRDFARLSGQTITATP